MLVLVKHSHFAVSHFPGFVVFPQRTSLVAVQLPDRILSSSFSFLEYYPLQPSRSAAAGRLLSWALLPFSTLWIGGSLAAGFACPLRSTFRVWLPSWWLTPADSLAGYFSHRQRSWDSPFGAFSSREASRRITTGKNPPTVSPADDRVAEAAGRHSRPQFLGLNLPGVPGDR